MDEQFEPLNLTYQAAHNLHKTWMSRLQREQGKFINVKYGFDESEPTDRAATAPDGRNGMIVQLGVHGLSPDTNPDTPVDVKKFVYTTVNLFHEAQHVWQEYEERMAETPFATDLVIADVAYRKNWKSYRRRYLTNLHELDAEFTGILNARDVLSSTFPNVNCDQLIVDYVNDRISGKNLYFIGEHGHPKYSTVAEIENAFGDAFDRYETTPHRFVDVQDPDVKYTRADHIAMILVGDKETAIKWQQFTDRLSNATTGQTYDTMAASVMLHAYPEYLKKYNALRNVDLSAETVFGMKFPESTASIRLRLGEPLPIPSKKLTKSVRTETTAEQATRPAPRKTLRPRRESVPAPKEPRPAATPPTPPPARRPPARTPTYGPETMRAVRVAGDVSAPDDGLDAEYDE